MQIIDIHSITTATDWVFGDGRTLACFALVSFSDESQGGEGVAKMVIPIGADEVGENLLGRFIEEFDMEPSYIGLS